MKRFLTLIVCFVLSITSYSASNEPSPSDGSDALQRQGRVLGIKDIFPSSTRAVGVLPPHLQETVNPKEVSGLNLCGSPGAGVVYWSDIGPVLNFLRHVTDLDLRGTPLKDHFQDIIPGLRGLHLTSLNLNGTKLGMHETCLLPSLLRAWRLRLLDLGHNRIGPDVLDEIAQNLDCGRLTSLNLETTEVVLEQPVFGVRGASSAKGYAALNRIIASAESLSDLNLSGNGIPYSRAVQSLPALVSHPTLSVLDWTFNASRVYSDSPEGRFLPPRLKELRVTDFAHFSESILRQDPPYSLEIFGLETLDLIDPGLNDSRFLPAFKKLSCIALRLRFSFLGEDPISFGVLKKLFEETEIQTLDLSGQTLSSENSDRMVSAFAGYAKRPFTLILPRDSHLTQERFPAAVKILVKQ